MAYVSKFIRALYDNSKTIPDKVGKTSWNIHFPDGDPVYPGKHIKQEELLNLLNELDSKLGRCLQRVMIQTAVLDFFVVLDGILPSRVRYFRYPKGLIGEKHVPDITNDVFELIVRISDALPDGTYTKNVGANL